MHDVALLPSRRPTKDEVLEMNEDVFCIYFYRFQLKLATADIFH